MALLVCAGLLGQAAAQSQSAAPARGICLDEDSDFGPSPASPAPVPDVQPREQMQRMLEDALSRSQAVGAARLMAEAARLDVDEMSAARDLQGTLGGGLGPGGSRIGESTDSGGVQLRATVNLSKLIYDGGRTDSLVNWKQELAESAKYGHLEQREQLALTAVGLALERGRYRTQAQVYQANVRKMSCLVKALETVVRADRGRASELAQAQKALEQAQLSQSQTQSQVRQTEIRLRRLVGDGLPPTAGLATLFNGLPPLETLLSEVAQAHQVHALGAQAQAASRYVEAAAAADKPQLRWAVAGTAAKGVGASTASGNSFSGNYSVGVMLSVPLWAPGNAPALDAAQRRAQAAQLQQADELESRRWRVADLYEQAQAAEDRLRRLAEVLRSSEQVRNATIQQWQQLGRRSLFDVMSAESEHYALRVAYVNALFDLQQINANLVGLGRGVTEWLR